MATGSFSTSAEYGSEAEMFECSHCATDGKHIEAINSCVECRQNFCSECLHHHNKFPGLRNHKILEKNEMVASGLPGAETENMQRCTIHCHKVIDMFCGTHDVVCCGACAVLSHRYCKNVDYISQVAKQIDTSQEFTAVKCSIKAALRELHKEKKSTREEIKRLSNDQTNTHADIDQFRNIVVKYIDDLVRNTKEKVDEPYTDIIEDTNTHFKAIKETSKTLKKHFKCLEESQEDTAATRFLHTKQGKRNTADCNKMLHDFEKSVLRKTIEFTANSNVLKFIKDLKSIGDLQMVKSKPFHSTVLRCQCNIRASDDEETCDIAGICLLEDRTIVVADSSNQKLKRLSERYKLIDVCMMPAWPCDVCSAGPTDIAVTFIDDNIVQFVSIRNKMKLTHCFHVDKKCRSVAFCNGVLYVLCEGETNNALIYMYDMSGNLKKAVAIGALKSQTSFNLVQIAGNKLGNVLHITCRNNGMINTDSAGTVLCSFTDQDLDCAYGICIGEEDLLFVSGHHSHNIFQVESNGKKVNLLLSKADGIKYPQALCYDKVNARLIVTMYNVDCISVFDLNRRHTRTLLA